MLDAVAVLSLRQHYFSILIFHYFYAHRHEGREAALFRHITRILIEGLGISSFREAAILRWLSVFIDSIDAMQSAFHAADSGQNAS